MATSSQALARAGLIDPTKPGTYPVILGDDIRRGSDASADRVLFTGIRYNFKPKHLTDKTTQKTSTLTSNSDGDFGVTFRDNSGGRYIFAGQRVAKGGKYVLVFDSKARKFILHRLDSLFVMNMTDTPTDHDTDGLKKRHPFIDALTKRPRIRGSTPLARRPMMMKKTPGAGGPLRPMQKLSARPAAKPTVLRSSHEIKKKDKRTMLSVPSREPDRETKAAKEVREQREAIIVKDARSSKEAREMANGGGSGGSGGSGSGGNSSSSSSSNNNSPSSSSSRNARDAALVKSREAALAARPKESSKLSRVAKASPDGRPNGYGSGDDYKSRSIDVRSGKGPKPSPTKDSSRPKATEQARPKLPERPSKDTEGSAAPAKGSARESAKETARAAAKKDAGKEAPTPTPRAKDGGKAGTPSSAANPKPAKPAKSASKAKAPAPPLSLPMPMPSAPPPKPQPPEPQPKKKHRDWEEDDDDDDDEDDDFGLVIEYPKGPSNPVRGAAANTANGRSGAQSSTPQLHMTTFAEFANGGDGDDDDDDGYWDPAEDEAEKKAAPAPPAAPAPAAPGKDSSSSSRKAADHHHVDDDDDGDADLEAELEEELSKEMNAGVDADAALEAELEAELFAAESESEISEEE